MFSINSLIVAGLVLLSPAIPEQLFSQENSTSKQDRNPLEPMAYLVGGKWTADEAADECLFFDEISFEWILNKRFIRARLKKSVESESYEAEEIYGWDWEGGGALQIWRWDSKGAWGEGEGWFEGDVIHQDIRLHDSSMGRYRSTIMWINNDEFVFTLYLPGEHDGWKPAVERRFKRLWAVDSQ